MFSRTALNSSDRSLIGARAERLAAFKAPPVVHRRRGLSRTAPRAGPKESWDFGRFLKTVFFFNPLPTPQSLLASVSRRLSPQEQGSESNTPGAWVLVTGATGGVGKRVVVKLLEQGCNVRALVRQPDKAQQLLGAPGKRGAGQLEVVVGDITRPQSLQPGYFRGVRAVISATAATVAPKEGDTPDRQKYSQGIKFYEPEVVGQTPEAVEFRGVQNLLQAAKQGGISGDSVTIFDGQTEGPAVEWGPLDDVVMGGVSQSSFARMQTGGQAVFSGRVSAANNGGFASVRTRNFQPPLDAGGCDALRLRVQGDGQRYKLTVRTDDYWDGIGYTQSFDTRAGEWQDVVLPFSAFRPIFRARTKPDAPAFDPATIVSVQLMLSKFEYDGELNPNFRLGDFSLPIAEISAVKTSSSSSGGLPKVVHVSSAGVTRPGRPGLDLEKEPPAVRMNDQLGGLLTWKLAGEDVIRSSGLPFAIVRPVALTEEPAGAPLEIAQGDTIKGKISREEVAELCVALLEQPAATNTTFEIKSTVPFSQPFQVDPSKPKQARDWGALLRAAGLRPGVTGKHQPANSSRRSAGAV